MSKGRYGFPRIFLDKPYEELYVPELYHVPANALSREGDKHVDKYGRSRFSYAADRYGCTVEIPDKTKTVDKRKKKTVFKDNDDFDKVKYRVMKKFFIKISNQKAAQERKRVEHRKKMWEIQNRNKNRPKPIQSRIRNGGNNGH